MNTKRKDPQSFVSEVTSGLKKDAELRAEVGKEMSAHLEDAHDKALAEGKSEDESWDIAMKSFGSPVEVAEELIHSNAGRMKLRASARFVLGRLMLPLSLLIAVLVFVNQSGRIGVLQMMGALGDTSFFGALNDSADMKRLDDKQAFLWYGDKSRETRSQQQRAIWERSPDNRVYFANYISHVLNESSGELNVSELATIARELGQGEQLDPDNAFYNYVYAAILFRAGATLKPVDVEGEKESYELEIRDLDQLQRAVEELRKADAKPVYRRYILDMAGERLDLLPPAKRIEDRLVRIAHLVDVLLPDLNLSRELFRALPYYAEHLVETGDSDDVDFLLDAWHSYVEKAHEDAFTLIDSFVIASIIERSGERNAHVYVSMNRLDDAARTKRNAEKLGAAHQRWNEARESEAANELNEQIEMKGSMLSSLLMPAFAGDIVTPESLRPGRMLDHNLAEQGVLALIMFLLLLFMFAAAALYVVSRMRIRSDGTPMLLLPPMGKFLLIFATGIILPICLYMIYSRWSGFGSHEFGIQQLWPLALSELMLLGLTLLATTTIPVAKHVWRRCNELGVPAPATGGTRLKVAFWLGLAASWILCGVVAMQNGNTGMVPMPLVLSALTAAAFLIVCLCKFVLALSKSASFGLYYSTMGRSLIAVYACAAIFVGAICMPYLASEETRLLHEDELISLNEARGFTEIEAKSVERLQNEMNRAFEEVER